MIFVTDAKTAIFPAEKKYIENITIRTFEEEKFASGPFSEPLEKLF